MSLEKCIISWSERSISHIEAVKQLLVIYDADTSFLTRRAKELHDAHLKLMERMGHSDASIYTHTLKLKDTLNQHEAFLDTRSPGNMDSIYNRGKLADKTFKYIDAHVSDEWSFVTTTPDPNQLMSKMLLKGYALFLEFSTKVNQLAPQYEHAMMEVLQNDFPGSTLATDLRVSTSPAPPIAGQA